MANENEFNLNQMLDEIKGNIKQKKASAKDETLIMQAMLNDTSFSVEVFTNSGSESHCPASVFKNAVAGVISDTTKISKQEASELMNNYNVGKSAAEAMCTVSKDFLNTTLSTGRKVNLGGTQYSNISMHKQFVEETTKSYPVIDPKTGKSNGMKTKTIPGHEVIKCSCSCPKWLFPEEK